MFAPSPRPPAVLDTSLAVFFNWLPKDCRIGNPDREFWEQWHYVISLYGFHCTAEEYKHEQCWGWTTLRTSYDDDEEFTLAVAAIQRLALVRLEDEYRESRTRGKPDNNNMSAVEKKLEKVPDHTRERLQRDWSAMAGPARDALPEGEPLTPDWVITNELVRRYHNIVVQDRQALDGADVTKAWGYANALGLQGRDGPDGEYTPGRESGPRSHFFIYLDKESIHRLAQAPSQEELARMAPGDRSKTAWEFWVKVISNNCKVGEDDEDTDEMSESLMGRRRLRLYDFFDTFMHLCHGNLEEMSVEGWGHERFVRERFVREQYEEREWELCGNYWWSNVREPWLQELYGGVVPSTHRGY